ncbi:uncharacterized protein RB166_014435 [Leptodactylus fuscus]|uniref:uncharacterized protein LOC142214276 n=1 Tax=Leptodactylus fuscus TaxID=238119 RepID=UPI003F4EE0AA
MKMLQVVVATSILSAAAAVSEQTPIRIVGVLYSSKNVTSPFGPNVRDLRWKLQRHGTIVIASVKNGLEDYVDTRRYELFNNGTILCIKNLTESGNYIIDVTLQNGTSIEETFILTAEKSTFTTFSPNTEEVEKSNHLILGILLPTIALLVVVVVWWRCKRSSTTSGQEEVNKSRYHVVERISSIISKKGLAVVSCKYFKTSSNTSGQEIPEEVVIGIHPDRSNEYSEISRSSLTGLPDTFSCDIPTEEEVDEEYENPQEQDELIEKNHIEEPMPWP